MGQNQPKAKKARVGVSGKSAESLSVQAMLRLLEEQGAEAVLLLDRKPERTGEHLAGLSALVVMGNDYDIDPLDYGCEDIHPATKRPSSTRPADKDAYERSLYEKALVREALKMKLPLMGVCGGMQRINVELGGTLHQHIPDLIDHALHAQKNDVTPFHIPVQFVAIDKNSLLGEVSSPSAIAMPAHGATEGLLIAENSVHHQAIDQLAPGLKPSAKSIEQNAAQDIVEAFEPDPEGPLNEHCIMGMQFHPEFRASDLGGALAEMLVENALLYAECKEKEQNFNAQVAFEQLRQKRLQLQAMGDPRTTIAKSNINMKVLHQLGVFRSMEELRTIPMANIQEALVNEHKSAAANVTRAPPDKGFSR